MTDIIHAKHTVLIIRACWHIGRRCQFDWCRLATLALLSLLDGAAFISRVDSQSMLFILDRVDSFGTGTGSALRIYFCLLFVDIALRTTGQVLRRTVMRIIVRSHVLEHK